MQKKIKNFFTGKTGQLGMGTGIAARSTPTTNVDSGTIFLILACIIFYFDLSGIFGGRYTGFELVDFSNFSNIAINVFTSAIFVSFCVMFLIMKIVSRQWESFGIEVISFGLFAFVITGFLVLNYWTANPYATVHFIFWILFGLTFIRSNEDPSAFYIITAIFLVIDFFGYSLLQNIVVFRYLPFLFVMSAMYIYMKRQNILSIVLLVFIVLVTMIFCYKDVEAQGGGAFSIIANTDGPTIEETREDFANGWNNFFGNIQTSLNNQMQYAVTGTEVKPESEPLGVYLQDVKADETRYYTDEDVLIWGTVTAKSLEDEISINLGCYEKKNKIKGEIDPATISSAYVLEDFYCKFGKNVLPEGAHTVITYANFDFKTEAEQKVYFMNRETLRSMSRTGIEIDPFADSAITDRIPVATFTGGPLRVEMGVSTDYEKGLLIGVSDSSAGTNPTLTIRIRNNAGWKGKLEKLNSVTVTPPEGVELINAPGCEISNGVITFKDRREREYEESIFEEVKCRFKPSMSALEGPKITTKYFKVLLDYNYRVEESVAVNIEEYNPDE
jgi:hypothetical protein